MRIQLTHTNACELFYIFLCWTFRKKSALNKSGFFGNGVKCHEVDECEIGADDCSVNADCTNTKGKDNK